MLPLCFYHHTRFSAYEMTEEKIFLPSTEENYNVDDLSSNDETDDEENPRKTIPSWAQSKLSVAALL